MSTRAIEMTQLNTPPVQPFSLRTRGYLEPSNPKLVRKVTRVSQAVFSEQPLFSEIVADDGNFRADGSWGIRNPTDLLSTSPSLDALNAGQRQTTAIPAVVGLYRAFKAGEKAEQIGDSVGQTVSTIDKVGSGIQLLYALHAIAGRVTALWATFKPSPALLAVCTTIGKILGYMMPILYLAFAIAGAYGAKNARAFYQEYQASDKSFAFLRDRIYLNQDTLNDILDDSDRLRDVGRKALSEKGNPTTLDAAISALGLSEIEEYYIPKFTENQLELIDGDLAPVIGLLLELQKKQACNEAALERSIGAECVALIKKSAVKGLQTRLENGDAKARADFDIIKAKIEKSYTYIQRLNMGLAILGTITVILSIIGLLIALSNPVSAAVMVVLSTLLALTWTCYDIYVYASFEGRPGKLDKPILLFSSVITLIGSALAIGTAATAGAPVTLALSIALCILLLGVYSYGYHKITTLEEKFKQNQPLSLQELRTHLHSLKGRDPVGTYTHALFKKLSKFDRQRLTDYTETLPFKKNIRFNQWNKKGQFAKNFLYAFFDSPEYNQDTQYVQLLCRAAKKTAKHYWTAYWYREQDNTAKTQALMLQNFLRHLENKEFKQAQAIYKNLSKETQEQLHTQITRVFKRDLSVASLRTATDHLRYNP